MQLSVYQKYETHKQQSSKIIIYIIKLKVHKIITNLIKLTEIV